MIFEIIILRIWIMKYLQKIETYFYVFQSRI